MATSVLASTTEAISTANDLLAAHGALISKIRQTQQDNRRQLHTLHTPPHELLRLPLIPASPPSPTDEDPPEPGPSKHMVRADLPPAKRARVARYKNYVPEEETIRNDYSQRYVDGGEWPQNWVLGADPEHRFEEYPKQQRLLNLKKVSVNEHALPPSYLSFNDLGSLQGAKFDVILLDPPYSSSFSWDHLQDLSIPTLAADPSFVFLWVGSGAGEGLERGREILAKWGYRRCEDVVWVKTNKTNNRGPGTDPPTTSLLTRTKQHCLVGIHGTVRRSTDSWFVHCNIDTDVIIWEGDDSDPTRKPPEMYTLIENFCLGVRRLEIFGKAASSLRRGWVTALAPGQDDQLPRSEQSDRPGVVHVEGEEGGNATQWDKETWEEGLKQLSNGGRSVVPMTSEIDSLRPKSPFRAGQTSGNNASGNNPAMSSTGSTGQRFNMGVSGGVGVSLGNRPGFVGGHGGGHQQVPNQNQMGMQPMLGMGMNALGMGMGNPMGIPEDVMAGWNPMLGSMNVAGLGGLPNVGAVGMGLPMMNQIPMGAGFQPQGPAFGGNVVFNNAMGTAMNWADQGQFHMENSWEGENQINVGMGMGMNPAMGMGQWGNTGGYEGNF